MRLDQDKLREFLSICAHQLPGNSPGVNETVPLSFVTSDGLNWRMTERITLPKARKLLKKGAQLWCTDEGSWPPHVVDNAVHGRFIELILSLGFDEGDPMSEIDDSDIELWRPRWNRHHNKRPGKGHAPKPVVFFRLY